MFPSSPKPQSLPHSVEMSHTHTHRHIHTHTHTHTHTQAYQSQYVLRALLLPQLTLGEFIHLLSKATWCALLMIKMLTETEPATLPQKILKSIQCLWVTLYVYSKGCVNMGPVDSCHEILREVGSKQILGLHTSWTYRCDSWTIKKAEHWRIDAFKLWYWKSLLRVPWTARRSNQSILKEIIPE